MNTNEINGRQPTVKRRKFGWIIHLMIFMGFQFIFFMLDGSSGWHIFRLNPHGAWAVDKLSPLVEWFQIYDYEYFNIVTLAWGIILMVDVVVSIISNRTEKKGKSA